MSTVYELWAAYRPWIIVAAALLGTVVAVASIVATVRTLRADRHGDRKPQSNMKLFAGTVIVQAGVTWAVVTGTYDFGAHTFRLPRIEAVALAVFLEAATWVCIGMIYDHARNGGVGFGPAGPFFWLFSSLGGLLAIIAGDTAGEMTGRAVIVIFGTGLWYLQLLRKTRRPTRRGSFRWSPRRLLVSIGAIAADDQDVLHDSPEWLTRRMAKAMRQANSAWRIWAWRGKRTMVRLAERADQETLMAARRRYAVAHLVTTTIRPDSPVMQAVMADIERDGFAATALPTPEQTALEDAERRAAAAEALAQQAEAAAADARAEAARQAEAAADAQRQLAAALETARELQADADTLRRAQTDAATLRQAEADARAADKRADAEALRRAEADARAAQERADAEALRRADADARAERADADARAAQERADAEAKRRAEADARAAQADADARAARDDADALREQAKAAEIAARATVEAAQREAAELRALLAQAATARNGATRRTTRTTDANGTPLTVAGKPIPHVDRISPETVHAVLQARHDNPDAKTKQLASLADTSERTVRRVLAAATDNPQIPGQTAIDIPDPTDPADTPDPELVGAAS